MTEKYSQIKYMQIQMKTNYTQDYLLVNNEYLIKTLDNTKRSILSTGKRTAPLCTVCDKICK